MAQLDYSKWDHIEVSDDEDDTHPNIDTPSLFRWRHQARVERDVQFKKEKVDFESDYKTFLKKMSECQKKLDEAKKNNSGEVAKLTREMADLRAKDSEWHEKETDMKKKEKIINSAALKHDDADSATDEAKIDKLQDFVKKHEKLIEKFGLFQKPVDSRNFLAEHPNLVCEETASHLVLWCIDLAMEEKLELMNHVSHQCIVMQFMLELAKSLKCDPRACIRPFFAKFTNPEPEYHRAFNDELSAFRDRIRARAKVRMEEAVTRLEEEERQKRIGPGGLDPIEVFDSLPQALQACFESKDVDLLKKALISMDQKDAEYHMKRCVDSGLWVDNVNKTDGDDEYEGGVEAGEEPEEEDEEGSTTPSKDTVPSTDASATTTTVASSVGGDATPIA